MNRRAILLVFIISKAFSQSSPVDSVDVLVKQLQPGNYHAIFERIDQKLISLDSATAIRKIQSIIEASRFHTFKGILIRAYESAAWVYQRHDNVPKAIEVTSEAYAIAKANRYYTDQADNLRILGQLYRTQNKYGLALRAFLNTIELYKQLGYHHDESKLYYEIGNVYYQTDDYVKAIDFLQRATQVSGDTLESRLNISAHNTLGLIYESKGDVQRAMKEFTLSLQMAQQKKDTAWIGIASGSIGKMYAIQNDYERAIEHYQTALTLSKQYKEWDPAVNALASLGKIYAKRGDDKTAKKYYEQAFQIVDRWPVFQEQLTVFENLSQFYAQIKEYDKAYQYYVRYKHISDSLQARKNKAEIERIQAAFDLNKRQAEISLLKKSNQVIRAEATQRNTLLLTVSITLLFILIIAILLYINNRQKHRSNQQLTEQKKELYEKNEEIFRQNEEIMSMNNNLEGIVTERTQQLQTALENLLKQNQDLEQFSYIISHNMRSPISQILGLVSIFDRDNPTDPLNTRVLNDLEKSANNLNAIVYDLNEILSMRNHTDFVEEKIQFDDVFKFVAENLSQEIRESQAVITTDFSKADTIVAFRSYIHSILYNLLSNAIKYRSPRQPLKIHVQTALADGFVCLSVQDNGLGMNLDPHDPQKIFRLYQRMHTHTEGRGLGLYLVKEQAQALGGKVEVESMPNQGSTFRIYLKQKDASVVNQADR